MGVSESHTYIKDATNLYFSHFLLSFDQNGRRISARNSYE